MISVSARTKRGATPGMVFLYPFQVIADTVEQNPSTLAAVGQETKGMPSSFAQYLVVSWMVPLPTATR